MHARNWHFFRHFVSDANPPYTPEEIERYVEAWSQPGAAAGMINYYRASVRQSQKEAVEKLRPISAPTLVIWGERDSYLGSDLAEPDRDDVPNLDRVERLADASHWVHHDEANASINCSSTSLPPRPRASRGVFSRLRDQAGAGQNSTSRPAPRSRAARTTRAAAAPSWTATPTDL